MNSEQAYKAKKFIDDVALISSLTKVNEADGVNISLELGLAKCLFLIETCHNCKKKLIFIGNGGSAAIANHQALDYWKNGGVKAISFSDSSLLTCLSNDFGYRNVFSKSIDGFADEGDLLFAISSSGKSENILYGVDMAVGKKCTVVTFSGFSDRNPLRKKGQLNFYVPSASYGAVEVTHHLLIHSMLEARVLSARDHR